MWVEVWRVRFLIEIEEEEEEAYGGRERATGREKRKGSDLICSVKWVLIAPIFLKFHPGPPRIKR